MFKSQPSEETLLLKQPTVSSDAIAFLYAGDIWVAGRDGSSPRRLTAQKGPKYWPVFSPDGQWIAFSGNYDGNLSVYVVSSTGGMPRRLTYHPMEDAVRGWTPDGKQVLFSSARQSIAPRSRQLFTIPLEGGLPQPLPMKMSERGSYSPDGGRIAYTPFYEAFWTWKRYRGGTTTPIWVIDLHTYDSLEIPHENATDTYPCWVNDAVYFLSDRNRYTNLFCWDSQTNQVRQITHYEDFEVRSLTAGGGALAYEQAGRIHLFDPSTGRTTTLHIAIDADLPEARPHFVRGARFIQNAGISPSEQRAVFEVRGEILSVPAKKGDIRNLTRTPGVAERFPAWSPDGQSIAYFSDASGEYDLVISDQKGIQKETISLGKQTFFYHPLWSPDSKKIAFTDKALNLYVLDLASKEVVCVDSDTYDHPMRTLNPNWSPDSQWLAYTRRLDNQLRAVFIYDLARRETHQVTDGMSDNTDACFSRDGKLLFFTGSTNYGLNVGWLDMTSLERPVTRSLHVMVLSRDDPSPLAPESDEEPAAKDASPESETGQKAQKEEKPAPVAVKIDWDGLDQRILALPLEARDYSNLQTSDRKLFYLESLTLEPIEEGHPSYNLHVYDLKERKDETFIEKVANYWISSDGKKLLYRTVGESNFAIVGTDKKPEGQDGILNLETMDVWVDPQAEWRQIYREAYRIHRDYFYDARMHGLDLKAAHQKYEPFLAHLAHRDDLNYLLGEFSGELVVGHAYVAGGDIPNPDPIPVGLLGADYEVDDAGYYRISRIYPGLNWYPQLRAPLTEPGVNVREGEYLLGVNGQPLRAPTSVYSLFQKTANRNTDLLIGPSTDPSQARTVTVKPVASETELRKWSWVEGNRKKVDELSQGRVAYIYMPDTHMGGYSSFNRYYFSQLHKQAVIIDERFNGGGSVADYILDMLDRKLLSYWATREGKPFSTPNASIFGPKVMIINQLAGSGGDAMPHFFRRRGLGQLVGKRTWGGLVGIYDYPSFIDGGMFTSPRVGIFSPDGEWEVENVGVWPDVDIEQTPKEVIAGHDPQLEKAVEVILFELEKGSFIKAPRPASPNRVD